MTDLNLQKQPPRFQWLRRRKQGRGFQSHSLTTRLVVLILLALVVSHALAFVIVADERRLAWRDAARELAAQRMIAVIELLESSPPVQHRQILAAASSPGLRFRLSEVPFVGSDEVQSQVENFMRDRLADLLERPEAHVRLTFQPEWAHDRAWFEPKRWRSFEHAPFLRRWHDEAESDDHHDDDDDHEDHDDDEWERDRHRKAPPRIGLLASVRLDNGTWLNAASALRRLDHGGGAPVLLSLGLSAIAIVVIVIWLVRRTMRPLRKLTRAADQFGQGERPEAVPEEGPTDIRNLISAFNTMRGRIDRFVGERMQMLAALSHDLRTPITTLRLRAELMEDETERDRFLATLDELQAMTEEVLNFVRAETSTETTVTLDTRKVLNDVADEFREAGASITITPFEDTGSVRGRVTAMKRALRNLISNAVRHGTNVELAVHAKNGILTIEVCDDGPGIPTDELERAFDPFVRLDPARGKDTGGVGLGLSIARSIARAHGGTLTLSNRPQGGLCAALSLPETDGEMKR